MWELTALYEKPCTESRRAATFLHRIAREYDPVPRHRPVVLVVSVRGHLGRVQGHKSAATLTNMIESDEVVDEVFPQDAFAAIGRVTVAAADVEMCLAILAAMMENPNGAADLALPYAIVERTGEALRRAKRVGEQLQGELG